MLSAVSSLSLNAVSSNARNLSGRSFDYEIQPYNQEERKRVTAQRTVVRKANTA